MALTDVTRHNCERWVQHANLTDLALVLDVIADELVRRNLPGYPRLVQSAHDLRCIAAADLATRYREPIRSTDCSTP